MKNYTPFNQAIVLLPPSDPVVNELCQITVKLMAVWAHWQCAWGPPSLAGPRCEARLVGVVWVALSPQFPTSPQHQGKWATKAMPLLNAPLGMLIDLLLQDKQKLCVLVHLGKIKSTGFSAWHRAVCLPLVCVDSFNLTFQTPIYKEVLKVLIKSN